MHLRYAKKNIPIELLRSLVAVIDHHSMSKAAAHMELTSSAVSDQIKRLERLVGCNVFVRSGRGLVLTQRGDLIAVYARRILMTNDQILALAGSPSPGRMVRIGIQNHFAERMLLDALGKCAAAFPDGRVQFACDTSPGLLQELKSGHLDLIFALAPLGVRLTTVGEWSEQLVWTRASDFHLEPGASIPLVILPNGFADRFVLEALDESDLSYTITFSAGDTTSRVAAAAAGLGYMVAPERAVPDKLVIAREDWLPTLPQLRAGIFARDGLDLSRMKPVVRALEAAVKPGGGELPSLVTPPRRKAREQAD
jgi:DNA-binding transcriptional LysR family regulator